MIADPVGVPVHHTKIEAAKRYETVEPATSLSEEFSWFFLGLAYCVIKIDRSLFEVYQSAGGISVPIKSHRADHPIASVQGADEFDRNPWSGTIQGISHFHARPFMDFISSYEFARKDTGDNWRCTFQQVRITDPLVTGEKRPVDCWFALPVNLTKKRYVRLNNTPGIFLSKPIFGMFTARGRNAA